MSEVTPAYNINKPALFERLGYKPHSAQEEFHQSNARFRLPCCGRRFGKSKMVGMDRCAELFKPKTLGWIVGPTYDLGEKEFRVMWDALMIGMRLGRDKRIKKAYNKRGGEMYMEMPWGSRVEVRSATNPEMLVGEGLHWAVMSEAAKHKEETWQRFILPMLLDYNGGADFPTTPEGQNWYYKLWQKGLQSTNEYQSWRMPSWLNTILFPDGREDSKIIALHDDLDEEVFEQEIAALFTSFAGRIFSDFQDETHIRPHSYRPEWPNYVAFDWGFTHPLAAVEFQVSPMDTVHVWREHYKSYMTLEDHVAELKAREHPEGYKIDLAFGDAADPEAAQYISQHYAPCLADPAAKENWRQGVNLIKRLIKLYHHGEYDEHERPVESPHYTVDPSCPNHIKEMNNYKRKQTAQQQSEHNNVSQKVDDHTIDAMRYALVSIFELGAGKVDTIMGSALLPDEAPVVSGASPRFSTIGSGGDTLFTREHAGTGLSMRSRF